MPKTYKRMSDYWNTPYNIGRVRKFQDFPAMSKFATLLYDLIYANSSSFTEVE